ncbi:lysophospholipid acyltransferase family protein [Sphingobacterium spiritivorum]|uniref:lysophospholipid acyltransferase family protein n=1 Tax=Sphingobacterium spiritivorum TaxID=258 RepID=UPI003DA1D666
MKAQKQNNKKNLSLQHMNSMYRIMGFMIGRIFRYRYNVIIQNFARAFPDMSYTTIVHHAHDFYCILGRIVIEQLSGIFRSPKLHVQNTQLLDTPYRENRHIIILMGHYGNWELLNRLPALLSRPVQALYKPLKNNLFDCLAQKSRTREGLRLLPSSQALRTLLKEKNSPHITVFLADQYPGPENGYAVTFLNQQTYAFSGAEKIAKTLNAYVVYGEFFPTGDYKWTLRLDLICESASQTSVGEITQNYTRKLEDSIIKAPSYWLWSHRRWK